MHIIKIYLNYSLGIEMIYQGFCLLTFFLYFWSSDFYCSDWVEGQNNETLITTFFIRFLFRILKQNNYFIFQNEFKVYDYFITPEHFRYLHWSKVSKKHYCRLKNIHNRLRSTAQREIQASSHWFQRPYMGLVCGWKVKYFYCVRIKCILKQKFQ